MSHVYLSTACLHMLHDECREKCKFCGERCSCLCHIENRAPSSEDYRFELVRDAVGEDDTYADALAQPEVRRRNSSTARAVRGVAAAFDPYSRSADA